MRKKATWLLEFRSNAYSQTGEDGIIQRILGILPRNDKWCVELGAWDGRLHSNTRSLIESQDYSAVLIEGDKAKFSKLSENYSHNKKVIAVNAFIGFEKGNSLDQILSMTPISKDFDFLSIDIDGNDYHVWEAMWEYRPKAVCIEFNPTIPTEVRFVQQPQPSVNQGASLLSLVDLGKKKGYELVSVLPFNAFFVACEYYPMFGIENNAPEVLRADQSHITYLFSGYDGRVFLHGNRTLPWHRIELKESRMQCLPRMLRKYPCNYSVIEKLFFFVYFFLSEPIVFLRRVRERLGRTRRRCA